jgi:polysaccharide export outer membrane protein
MEELRSQTVRVLGDGTFSLPLIGKLKVSGLTEEELREKIRERLRQFMYEPRVITFVKEYRNRQVAVLGSVVRPGIYSLKSEADTILDMLSQAGGIVPGADPHIHLIPAEPAEPGAVKDLTGALPITLISHDPSPLILKKTSPILIDLRELAYGGYQQYLSLPVRPGDVIMVPGGRQVLVEGWVEKPGAYNLTPGLTLSGLVAASGGPLYPADTTSVKVMRTEKGGGKTVRIVNLESIKNGTEADMALQGGDFIEVTATSGKLVPYSLYRFFTSIMHIAVGGTIPILR